MLKCLHPFCLLQLFLVIIHVTTACKYSCNKCSKRFFQWWRQPAPKHRLCRTVGHQNTFLRLEMSYLCMKWCVERWMTQCGSKTYTGGDTSCSIWLWWRFYNSYFNKYLLVVIYAWCTHVRTVESIGHAVWSCAASPSCIAAEWSVHTILNEAKVSETVGGEHYLAWRMLCVIPEPRWCA